MKSLKNQPKRKGVPLDRALQLVGETELFRGIEANVSWNWRERKTVPAEHVLERYVALTAGPADLTAEERVLLRLVRSSQRFAVAVSRLRDVWDKHGEGSREWDWLSGNIEVFGSAPPSGTARSPAAGSLD